MRSLSAMSLAKRCSLDLLSSSAHTFFSPAKCETASCTLCRADQDATSFKNWLSGSVAVKSLLMPAAADVLSAAAGKCLERRRSLR